MSWCDGGWGEVLTQHPPELHLPLFKEPIGFTILGKSPAPPLFFLQNSSTALRSDGRDIAERAVMQPDGSMTEACDLHIDNLIQVGDQ